MQLFQGDTRSVKAKKNMIASFFLKGLDGVIYLAIVPITLGFLNPYSYGLWLAISSILTWVNSLDIGLGNGLRNCLTKALAEKNYVKAKIYISTTYFLLFVLVLVILGIFFIVTHFIDWYTILNVNPNIIPDLTEVINYSFLFFCLSFIFKIIGNIYMSLQLPAVSSAFTALGYIVSLSIILIMKATIGHGTLMMVALVFSASPCLVYLVATPITFKIFYPGICPSFRYIKLRGYVNELMVVGVKFFILQICGLILQLTSSLIISNIFGPEEVTPYNISYRYMSIGILLMTVILSPIWSAVTDAQACGDINWIKNTLKKIRKVLLLLGLFLLVLLIVSKPAYHLWVGNEVSIPFMMSMLNALYVFLIIWSTGQSIFLNGLGCLKIQLYANIFQVIIYFPIVFYMGHMFGINGLIVGLILVNVPAAILNTMQLDLIISKKAKGLWLK